MYSRFHSPRTCETIELSLPVPTRLVKETVGLAMDMGASMITFVYRTRQNLEEANNESTIGHLQLVSFPKSYFNLALDYVKERCEITRTTDGTQPEIHTTGLGCTLYGKKISEKFNIRLNNMTEFDCFAIAFIYLAGHLSRRNLLESYDDAATEEPITMIKQQMELINSLQADECYVAFKPFHGDLDITAGLGKVMNDSDAPIDEAEDLYPCILAMCGSGFGYFLIKEDKTFQVVDGSNRGGMTFHGMGTLLTGCKTYDELIELAAHGDQRNVDIYSDYLFNTIDAAEGDASAYAKVSSHFSQPSLVYCFGKAVEANLRDFRREDLARAWLNYVVRDTVQGLKFQAQLHGVRRLFFCGSFCNSTLVRGAITTEIVRQNLFLTVLGNDQVLKFDFIKPGPYLGAFGALISGQEAKSSKIIKMHL